MVELERKDSEYVLNNVEGKLILSVSLDGQSLFELDYVLNSGEIYTYESQGTPFLANLARQIRENPAAFR